MYHSFIQQIYVAHLLHARYYLGTKRLLKWIRSLCSQGTHKLKEKHIYLMTIWTEYLIKSYLFTDN